MQMWLPENWEGGDADEMRVYMLESAHLLGPEFEGLIQIYEQLPQSMVLFAFDLEPGASGYLTNMNVSTHSVPGSLQMETILELNLEQLPRPLFQEVEQEVVTVDGYPTGRAVVETTVLGQSVKIAMYLIKRDDTIWAVGYGTSADEYQEMSPIFEQSIRTLEITPQN